VTTLEIGQIFVGVMIGIVGWFIKKEINNLGLRLDNHEAMIIDITKELAKVVGEVGILVKMLAANKGEQ
jgi:hypothetical protein